MESLSRREVLGAMLAAGVAMNLKDSVAQARESETVIAASGDVNSPMLHWLEGAAPAFLGGVTWGVPWPRGLVKNDQAFSLVANDGVAQPVQSWPLAYWPDGSLKWTAHAAGAKLGRSESYRITLESPKAVETPLTVKESDSQIEINTGALIAKIARKGDTIIQSLEISGKSIGGDAQLICLRSGSPEKQSSPEQFVGRVSNVVVEDKGPIRAVIKLEGKHVSTSSREWLPFTIRLYFYHASETVRIMHTFIFDGDEQKDFICGLGVRFNVAMNDAMHDRHVRFVGEGHGLFAEGVRSITGQRRDPNKNVREAQINGVATPPTSEWAPAFNCDNV